VVPKESPYLCRNGVRGRGEREGFVRIPSFYPTEHMQSDWQEWIARYAEADRSPRVRIVVIPGRTFVIIPSRDPGPSVNWDRDNYLPKCVA
jgi:hypothetical protein